MKLDTAAASRFITAAIPKSQRTAAPTSDTPTSKSTGNNKKAEEYEEVGMSSRFKHLGGEGEVLDLSRAGEE